MSEIIIGKDSGFCFGVRRASDMIEQCIADREGDERIYTLGKLIHNDIFNGRLAARGVTSVSEEDIEKVAASSVNGGRVTLVLRAHGVTAECEDRLRGLTEKYPDLDVSLYYGGQPVYYYIISVE